MAHSHFDHSWNELVILVMILSYERVRVRFFKKIQDWILKSKGIQKWILHSFTRQINPRSLGLWCVNGTEESTLEVNSLVPLMHHDPKDLGLICLVKKHKIHFPILLDLKIQSWIFFKECTNFVSFLGFLTCTFLQLP